MVKRLKRDIEDLNEYIELLDECVDRKTVVDLIQEIVLSIIDKKGLKGTMYKDSFYSSKSFENSNSVKIIEVRE